MVKLDRMAYTIVDALTSLVVNSSAQLLDSWNLVLQAGLAQCILGLKQ